MLGVVRRLLRRSNGLGGELRTHGIAVVGEYADLVLKCLFRVASAYGEVCDVAKWEHQVAMVRTIHCLFYSKVPLFPLIRHHQNCSSILLRNYADESI